MSMKALEWAMYDVPAEMVKGALLRILLLPVSYTHLTLPTSDLV